MVVTSCVIDRDPSPATRPWQSGKSLRVSARQPARLPSRALLALPQVLLALLALAAHGLLVGRVGAEVNAAFPGALERVVHVQAHASDLFEFYFDVLAVLQRAEALVVGAAGDEVAGI